jgi:hypothetical protein
LKRPAPPPVRRRIGTSPFPEREYTYREFLADSWGQEYGLRSIVTSKDNPSWRHHKDSEAKD